MAITYLVDVMAHIKKATLKDVSTFGELIERTVNTTNEISPRANRRDYVFDPPEDGSIKKCAEQMQRNPLLG